MKIDIQPFVRIRTLIAATTLVMTGVVFEQTALAAAQQIIVAKSGGNYTTVSAALAAINPSATTPYVIEVMPGTYSENVTMKSYVHLRGAGREVTTLKGVAVGTTIKVIGKTDVQISGLTITGPSASSSYGIDTSDSTSVSIRDNRFTGIGASIYAMRSSPIITGNLIVKNLSIGIFAHTNSSPQIIGNTISENGGGGISINFNSSPLISGNIISMNGGQPGENAAITIGNDSKPLITGNQIINNPVHGILVYGESLPSILGNTITGNGAAFTVGGVGITVSPTNANVAPIISGNTISQNTGHGVSSGGVVRLSNNTIINNPKDVTLGAANNGGLAYLSFNTANVVGGVGSFAGQYNVKSDGTPLTLP